MKIALLLSLFTAAMADKISTFYEPENQIEVNVTTYDEVVAIESIHKDKDWVLTFIQNDS